MLQSEQPLHDESALPESKPIRSRWRALGRVAEIALLAAAVLTVAGVVLFSVKIASGVSRTLETPSEPMRLQIVRLPDAVHTRVADPHLLGQPPRTPVRGIPRRCQRLRDDQPLSGFADSSWPSGAGSSTNPGQALPFIPRTPLADGHRRCPQPSSHAPHALSCRTRQHDACAKGELLRCRRAPQPLLESRLVAAPELKAGGREGHAAV
jgi:hypothetical protein